MQPLLEVRIRKMYDEILLKSNFNQDEYLRNELIALCRRITRIHEQLTILSLKSGQPATPQTNNIIAKIKLFACS